MKTILITRFKKECDYSLGFCFIKHEDGLIEYIGCSLERGWRDNKKMISCIPEGVYNLVLEYSNHFRKDLWEIYDVENRSECKFHTANYWRQLNGCIALGVRHRDIDGDGDIDVTSSRPTMKKFHEALKGQVISRVEIRDL